ncbi:MAG: type I-E CRISPR-associated protein Cse1/CasA [Dehalococcoidales bacterium]|nr:type I-E CRISPR-associated protein Cse1/CasA [Dehalococcoidales bacterium]
MSSYNLIDEKWIPCVMPDGRTETFSLQDVLVRAHEIKEVLDSSPLVTVSLHRLLLAILHRNFGPSNFSRWQELWNKEKWDENTLESYFSIWRHRFYLFDDERPFYQCKEIDDAERHPIVHLALEFSTGNNATLFDHNNDDNAISVPPAIAAQYVITTQAFAIGFGKSNPFYFSDTPLIRGFTTLVLGNSLFETLALNLIAYNDERPFPRCGNDLPIWEQEKIPIPLKEGNQVKGYIDYLTWQSRRIHLFIDDQMNVINCQIQQNLKLSNQMHYDPFKSFRKDEKKGFLPININPERAAWRDSHVLFQTSDMNYKRPEIFNWLARIDDARQSVSIKADPNYKIIITGLATDKGKAASVVLWRHERLPLPLQYLQDENLLDALKKGLALAEDIGKFLGSGYIKIEISDKKGKTKTIDIPSPLRNLASELLPKDQNGKANPDDEKKFVNTLSPSHPYWAKLGISFNELLVELPKGKIDLQGDSIYGANRLQWWAKEVSDAAHKAFEEVTNSLDNTGRSLRAIAIARDNFDRELNKKINEFTEPYMKLLEKGGEKDE